MNKQYIHFLHVGKTGGSAIKAALKDNKKMAERTIIVHRHHYTLADVPAGEKVFFFLRDPISRFISGFYSRQRQGQPRYNSPWTKGEEQAFSRFQTPNDLAVALCDDDRENRAAAQNAMASIRHIKDLYVKWLGDPDYFLSRLPDILFVGRQETLSEDFARLKRRLGLPDVVALPSGDKRTHKNPENLSRRLTKVAVRNLIQWYESDYAFLDLCNKHADEFGRAKPIHSGANAINVNQTGSARLLRVPWLEGVAEKRQPSNAIILLGSGRSGTSVLARSISFLGVDLGNNFIKPNRTNPKGFFEDRKIVRTHKKMKMGRRPFYDGWYRSQKVRPHRQELKEYVRSNFSHKPLWGWKDPRTNDYLELWQDILKELYIKPSYLIIVRNPIDVVDSSKRAYNRDETWARLQWQLRTLLALRNTYRGKRVIVEYDELFSDSVESMRKIALNLELPWPENEDNLKYELGQFIDPNLQTSNSQTDIESFKNRNDIERDVMELYLLCLEGARSQKFLESRSFHGRVEILYDRYLQEHGTLKTTPPKAR